MTGLHLGTYYVVPYTTGCKFIISSQPDGDAPEKLASGGKLSAKTEVAIREIHNRYDVDLDKLLDHGEFAGLLQELTGKAPVC